MEEINYYKANEVLENKYYMMLQELFENSLYKYALNSDGKLLYMFLLDRLTLSQKNNWYDKNGNVYVIIHISIPYFYSIKSKLYFTLDIFLKPTLSYKR